MRKILQLCLFLLIYLTFIFRPLYPVYAEEATSSPSIMKKLEELKKEIASKAAKIKAELTSKLQNKFYIGKIAAKDDRKITISDGVSEKTVLVNEYTVYLRKDGFKKSLNLDLLKADDFVAGLGEIDDNNNLLAKKLVLLTPPANLNKEIVWGEVVKVNGRNLTISLKENKLLTLIPGDDVAISDEKGEVPLHQIQAGAVVAAVGFRKNNNLETRFIYKTALRQPLKLNKDKSSSVSAKNQASTSGLKK